MSGTYRRNGYTEAQKRGIANWAKMNISGEKSTPRRASLSDQQFGELRRRVEDIQEIQRIEMEFREVWE